MHAEDEQTIAELEQATGIPQQSVSREVNRLLETGLVEGRRLGRLHLVKPNQASPYFPELAGLLLKALGPRSVLAERLNGVKGIEEAYIFGSWARRYEGEPGAPQALLQVISTWSSSVISTWTRCTGPAPTPVLSWARRSTR